MTATSNSPWRMRGRRKVTPSAPEVPPIAYVITLDRAGVELARVGALEDALHAADSLRARALVIVGLTDENRPITLAHCRSGVELASRKAIERWRAAQKTLAPPTVSSTDVVARSFVGGAGAILDDENKPPKISASLTATATACRGSSPGTGARAKPSDAETFPRVHEARTIRAREILLSALADGEEHDSTPIISAMRELVASATVKLLRRELGVRWRRLSTGACSWRLPARKKEAAA